MKEEILLLDNKHKIVKTRVKARWAVIHNYNNKGKLIKEAWLDLKGKGK